VGKEFVILPTAKHKSNKNLEFELTGQKLPVFEFSEILVQYRKGLQDLLFSEMCAKSWVRLIYPVYMFSLVIVTY